METFFNPAVVVEEGDDVVVLPQAALIRATRISKDDAGKKKDKRRCVFTNLLQFSMRYAYNVSDACTLIDSLSQFDQEPGETIVECSQDGQDKQGRKHQWRVKLFACNLHQRTKPLISSTNEFSNHRSRDR